MSEFIVGLQRGKKKDLRVRGDKTGFKRRKNKDRDKAGVVHGNQAEDKRDREDIKKCQRQKPNKETKVSGHGEQGARALNTGDRGARIWVGQRETWQEVIWNQRLETLDGPGRCGATLTQDQLLETLRWRRTKAPACTTPVQARLHTRARSRASSCTTLFLLCETFARIRLSLRSRARQSPAGV